MCARWCVLRVSRDLKQTLRVEYATGGIRLTASQSGARASCNSRRWPVGFVRSHGSLIVAAARHAPARNMRGTATSHRTRKHHTNPSTRGEAITPQRPDVFRPDGKSHPRPTTSSGPHRSLRATRRDRRWQCAPGGPARARRAGGASACVAALPAPLRLLQLRRSRLMEARRIAQPPPWRGDVAAHERSSLARRACCDGSPAARSARAARRWRRKLDSSAACRAAARAQRRAAAVQAPLHRAGRAVARALRPPHSAARDDGHDSAGTRTQPAGFERRKRARRERESRSAGPTASPGGTRRARPAGRRARARNAGAGVASVARAGFGHGGAVRRDRPARR